MSSGGPRGSIASLLELRERMNQLFDELVHPLEAGTAPVAWTPVADVVETAESFEISLELAGVEPDSVEVEVTGQVVTVRGTRPFPETCEEVHRMERRYGPFLRSFELPAPPEPGVLQFEARRAEEGVLHLTIRRACG